MANVAQLKLFVPLECLCLLTFKSMNKMLTEKRYYKKLEKEMAEKHKTMWNYVKEAQNRPSTTHNAAPKLGHNATYWQPTDYNT